MKWLERISSVHPLIECLTNNVTVNDVANVILASGASPVMGDAAGEIDDFIRIANAALINVGTLQDNDLTPFETLMECSARRNCPVVVDPVGVGAAKMRTDMLLDLMARYPVAVIRGNVSEIKMLASGIGETHGVDAAAGDAVTDENLAANCRMVDAVAAKYHCVVAMSGAIDLIGDGKRHVICRNGVPWMSRVTGTGCSLTGLTAAFVAVASLEERFDAVVQATAMMGIAGERAYRRTCHLGLGSFRVAMIDALSMLTDDALESEAKLEEVHP